MDIRDFDEETTEKWLDEVGPSMIDAKNNFDNSMKNLEKSVENFNKNYRLEKIEIEKKNEHKKMKGKTILKAICFGVGFVAGCYIGDSVIKNFKK